MKKLFLFFLGCSLTVISCYKHNSEFVSNSVQSSSLTRKCGDQIYDSILQSENPSYKRDKIIVEQQLTNLAENFKLLPSGVIQIPVVFNVIYSNTIDNVSQSQIQSQLDVLNEDYAALNKDYGQVPAIFQSKRSGDLKIQFVLDKIVRKKSAIPSWAVGNDMKQLAKGGLAPTLPTKKLNIWICTLSGGILGFSQFPGGSALTDGVVIDVHAFGRGGTALAPFDQGRTATHELGHWLGLHHIWGDAFCGDDLVSDTPFHDGPNYGKPAFPKYSTCGKGIVEMTMNFMDYVDDDQMHMFTQGQKQRIAACFVNSGPRNAFAKP